MVSIQSEKKGLGRSNYCIAPLQRLIRISAKKAAAGRLDDGDRLALVVAEPMEILRAPPISCAPVAYENQKQG
jgi:hypothetical protein